jgi:hypothetical protein
LLRTPLTSAAPRGSPSGDTSARQVWVQTASINHPPQRPSPSTSTGSLWARADTWSAGTERSTRRSEPSSNIAGGSLSIHSALAVTVPDDAFVIESAPIRDERGRERGVVAEGPVETRWAGRFRLFRYEIRRWHGGTVPDVNEAVSSPVRVADDLARAQGVLDAAVPLVPTLVWGRDQLGTGDMWNSNSLISWLLVRAGIEVDRIRPPSGGRAPGWDAGLVVSRRGM